MPYLFVYGSLKRGFENFERFLEDTIFEGESILEGYIMRSLTWYPMAHETTQTLYTIQAERFWVTEDILAELDILESVPDYYRRILAKDTQGRQGYLYICAKVALDEEATQAFMLQYADKIITSGIWLQPNRAF